MGRPNLLTLLDRGHVLWARTPADHEFSREGKGPWNCISTLCISVNIIIIVCSTYEIMSMSTVTKCVKINSNKEETVPMYKLVQEVL